MDGALRLVSPEVADTDDELSNGLPYVQKVCATCPLKTGCAAWTQKVKVENAKVLILQQQHLRLIDSKSPYFAGRVLIIDESCIGTALRW